MSSGLLVPKLPFVSWFQIWRFETEGRVWPWARSTPFCARPNPPFSIRVSPLFFFFYILPARSLYKRWWFSLFTHSCPPLFPVNDSWRFCVIFSWINPTSDLSWSLFFSFELLFFEARIKSVGHHDLKRQRNPLVDVDFFGLNPFRYIQWQWALPKYRTTQENSFFQLTGISFWVVKHQKSKIEDVVLGMASKWMIWGAFQRPMFSF